MPKIYQNAQDKNVAAVCIYVKTGDAYAYSDVAKTLKIKAAVLKDMFEKGCLIIDGTTEYKPVSFAMPAAIGTVTYVKTHDTVATTAVLATLRSE